MSSTTLSVLTAITMVMAACACVLHVRAASRGLPEFRPWHASVAIVSAIFVVIYGALLTTETTYTVWLRSVGIVAWPLVWCTPAILSEYLWRKLHRAVDQIKS